MSFIKDAIIIDVEKHDGGWWRGNYGRKKRKWSVGGMCGEGRERERMRARVSVCVCV